MLLTFFSFALGASINATATQVSSPAPLKRRAGMNYNFISPGLIVGHVYREFKFWLRNNIVKHQKPLIEVVLTPISNIRTGAFFRQVSAVEDNSKSNIHSLAARVCLSI
ncbi:hypothetical protein PTKIN_Ptkin01aG0250200 [Pterospermum kingtungense]